MAVNGRKAGLIPRREYVFVTWDPLYERPVCVHKKLDDTCKKCESISKKRWKEKSPYFLETKKFLVKE